MSQNGETAQFDDTQPQDFSPISLPASRWDNPTNQEQAAVQVGQEAWGRLRHDQTWEDWKHVGAAHLIGRTWAMHEAGVNRPVGHRYKAHSPLGSRNSVSKISIRQIDGDFSSLCIITKRSKRGARH
ncbi:MAG TPA: hypothetical protein VGZ89_16055 [Xanthobacteraceae bacterium]|nr:hypothetical protein [Xanthobacteraceae bacterium]